MNNEARTGLCTGIMLRCPQCSAHIPNTFALADTKTKKANTKIQNCTNTTTRTILCREFVQQCPQCPAHILNTGFHWSQVARLYTLCYTTVYSILIKIRSSEFYTCIFSEIQNFIHIFFLFQKFRILYMYFFLHQVSGIRMIHQGFQCYLVGCTNQQ